MIVVAVIAILAAIAIPSYMSQVRKARRSDALAQINAISLAEEQWRSNCPSYLNFGGSCAASSSNFMAAPASTYYTYILTPPAPSATGYTITATAKGAQIGDKQFGVTCSPLTYTSASGVITKAPATCWGQ